MNLEEALAFWDTLQRYMDVTQPLPELPILEQFRHLDPAFSKEPNTDMVLSSQSTRLLPLQVPHTSE
ncbi:hypothetical protein NA644_07690 [Pseudomonas stutzeri]|uniref:hypothetical protein n=1 Tax=Stutzerimonas stutzeri TaxID=316 RepID=UPI00039817B4|nr:hypothetical protein [Stutzerimonas stutzeri]EQM80068.1 hypothetical protein L686_09090 [Stutzerimonas stutzeri MF28]MCQ4249192.1 hypothetical protein [Stutzerimonas stutzeri]